MDDAPGNAATSLLDTLASRWQTLKFQTDKHSYWEKALGGLLESCRKALGDKQVVESVRAWLNNPANEPIIRFLEESKAYDPDTAALVRAHLHCVPALFHDGDWLNRGVSDAVLEPVAGASGLPLGFVREIAHALLNEPPATPEGPSLTVNVLFVNDCKPNPQGIVGTLKLERLAGGNRALFPNLAQAWSLHRGESFRKAEAQACAWVKNAGHWPEGYDVRWEIKRRDNEPLPLVTGPSMGAALALGRIDSSKTLPVDSRCLI